MKVSLLPSTSLTLSETPQLIYFISYIAACITVAMRVLLTPLVNERRLKMKSPYMQCRRTVCYGRGDCPEFPVPCGEYPHLKTPKHFQPT